MQLCGQSWSTEQIPRGHLVEFSKILTELFTMDVMIVKNNKLLLLLASIPALYVHIVTTLVLGKNTISFDEINVALLLN